MNAPVLTIDGAGKHYGKRRVVDGVSLSAEAGECIALLGHNGAGKTTLFKMILGLTTIDHGKVTVFGAEPGARRGDVAFLPENVAFHKALTGREQLTFYARLKGAGKSEVETLLQKVDLIEAANRRIGTYSKGMRQRLGLAQCLIGAPKLVLLDEPSSGLDPVSRNTLYDLIGEVAANGAAVILSSHALTEVEARTDRIVILRGGRLVADDALTSLRAKAGLPIRVRVRARADSVEEVAEKSGGVRVNGKEVEILCAAHEKMDRLAQITGLGGMVRDVDVIPPSLDDVYRYYSRSDDGGSMP